MRLTKRQAEKVMQLDLGKNTVEDIEHYTQPGMPALTFNGAKLYRRQRGCVSFYELSGYTYDSSDVADVVIAAGLLLECAQ